VAAGGLVSLSPDNSMMARQGGDCVNKIMKEAKPGSF
jgi:ABC-type uncharacterized transport system substrate-binding protein